MFVRGGWSEIFGGGCLGLAFGLFARVGCLGSGVCFRVEQIGRRWLLSALKIVSASQVTFA